MTKYRSDEAWFQRGMVRFTSNRFKAAKIAYGRALALNAIHIDAWLYLGFTRENLEDFEGAAFAFTNAIKIDPNLSWTLESVEKNRKFESSYGYFPIQRVELLQRYKRGERNFSHYELPENVDFRGTDLSGGKFEHVWFDGIDFTGADLHATSFRHSHLKLCTFDYADLHDADLRDSAVDAATFTGARLDGGRIGGAHAYGYIFHEGEISKFA